MHNPQERRCSTMCCTVKGFLSEEPTPAAALETLANLALQKEYSIQMSHHWQQICCNSV